jgi:G:T/U-mismatch repair DNA glycosylase
MVYKTSNEYKEESHDWVPYIPLNSTTLLLGTFPTREKNRNTYEFYYPNINNPFWKILCELKGGELKHYSASEAVNERKDILDFFKLGIADVGHKVYRQNDSSLDQNLFPIEFTDILQILDDNSTITKIIVTSSSGGHSVYSWLVAYLKINNIDMIKPKEKKNPKYSSFKHRGNVIDVSIISSTSTTAYNRNKEMIKEMYRKEIVK